MQRSEMKTDRHGWRYYDRVPEGFRLATMDDFHIKGTPREGLEFLVRWVEREYYQVCIYSKRMDKLQLNAFIEGGRVFVRGKVP